MESIPGQKQPFFTRGLGECNLSQPGLALTQVGLPRILAACVCGCGVSPDYYQRQSSYPFNEAMNNTMYRAQVFIKQNHSPLSPTGLVAVPFR